MLEPDDYLNKYLLKDHHQEFKRCKRCGLKKALWAFYRAKRCKGGHRPECKRCHALWRRNRFKPKTGRRNVTKSDKARARLQLLQQKSLT